MISIYEKPRNNKFTYTGSSLEVAMVYGLRGRQHIHLLYMSVNKYN